LPAALRFQLHETITWGHPPKLLRKGLRYEVKVEYGFYPVYGLR